MSLFPSTSGNPDSLHHNLVDHRKISDSDSQTQSRAESKGGLRHVTIRQVLKAAHVETHFEIDGQEVDFIAIFANVYDVNYRGTKLDYGLDDGSGRIKAFSWVTDERGAEREVAEYRESPFTFARVIGRISEYRGIYSIQLTKINRVIKEPHEIYHHLTKAMVESLMYKHGPPSRADMESAIHAARVNYPPPEVVTAEPPQDGIPSSSGSGETKQHAAFLGPPPRTPSPEAPQTPRRAPTSVPRSQQISAPDTLPNIPQPNTVPRRKNYRIGEDFPPPRSNNGPTSPSSSRLEERHIQPLRPSLAPVRFRSPSGPSIASMATLTHCQASPGSASPAAFAPPSPTMDRKENRFRNEDVRTVSPPRVTAYDTTLDMNVTKNKPAGRGDPYSHLSSLQRDILLTIQNSLSVLGNEEHGASIEVLVRSIARRRPGLDYTDFNDAFTFLLEEGYIYNTIDETHVACT